MRWLVTTLAPLVDIPLSIDSSNLEIIDAGVMAATEAADARVGPPMLNSASLERIEVLDLAARLKGAVVITAAGESGMPTNTEERVANASRMVEASLAAGIALERIFVDRSSSPSLSTASMADTAWTRSPSCAGASVARSISPAA